MDPRRWLALQAALLLLGPAAAAGQTHAQLALEHAPVLVQETNHPFKDLFSAFDFDGNWNGADNADHVRCLENAADCPAGSACVGGACPLVAAVYYSVQETATHWFIQYLPYHPLDWKVTNGHEHDTESVLMVVQKTGGLGTLQAMEVRFHTNWYQYAPAGNGVGDSADNVDGPLHRGVDGRVMVYSQMVGHGLCGGYAPVNRVFPDLQLSCRHDEAPHIDGTGVIYRPTLPATMPAVVDNTTVETGYTLVDLSTTIWAHIREIGPMAAFGESMDYTGERCAMFPACPTGIGGPYNGNEGSSPSHAWGQEGGNGVTARGSQFFDPAYTMSRRLMFPPPFSTDYCWNPFVGITTGCTSEDGGVTVMDAGTADAATGLDAAVGVDATSAQDAGPTTPMEDAGMVTVADAGAAPGDAPPPGRCGCDSASWSPGGLWGVAALVLAGTRVRRNPWTRKPTARC